MAYQVILRKLPTEVLGGSLEDVLTASVIGAVAYGPAEMARAFTLEYAGFDGASTGLRFDFWPGHRLPDGAEREPDALIVDEDGRHVLVIEAKRDADPGHRQLIEEGEVVRSLYPGTTLHLLTVSDQAVTPRAFRRVSAERPGLYASMRHVTWADLHRFLERSQGGGVDAGQRRLIEDALAVLRKFGRDPFRGMSRQEVRMMERDMGWMVTLPTELAKLHRNLSRALEGLHPPLYAIGRKVRTDIVGSVSYSTPEQWFPRHFTLRYGEAPDTTDSRYYFVRAVLNPAELWVGYAPRRGDIRALLAQPDAVERFARRAGKPVRLVAVTPKGRPFAVTAGPHELSLPTLQAMHDEPRVERMNLIHTYPMTLMWKTDADVKLEAELVRLIGACRSAEALAAP